MIKNKRNQDITLPDVPVSTPMTRQLPDMSDTAMLTAILPMNKSTLYIKLTASKDGIMDLEKDFKTFCSSIKRDTNN